MGVGVGGGMIDLGGEGVQREAEFMGYGDED